ncbi:MAG: hypothetical protein IKL25_01700 [Clostridia bacterium]|nr:hypothetical protein [Clostridia bacterium]
MLSHIFSALTDHLSRLTIPVYQADCVPEGAAFPYVTAEIAAPLTPVSAGSLTLTVWSRSSSAHTERLAKLDALHRLLPPRGAWLTVETGAITLTGDGPVRCLQDGVLLGAQSRWTLRFFPST